MSRKQAEIPGFERQVENPAVEEAAAKYCTIRDERSALSKKEKQAQLELEATMRAHNVERYEYLDDNGEVLVAKIVTGTTKAVVEKTGEAEVEIGEGVDDPSSDGLIADAQKAQRDAGVAEDEDGNVIPLDTAAPKKKRGSKA